MSATVAPEQRASKEPSRKPSKRRLHSLVEHTWRVHRLSSPLVSERVPSARSPNRPSQSDGRSRHALRDGLRSTARTSRTRSSFKTLRLSEHLRLPRLLRLCSPLPEHPRPLGLADRPRPTLCLRDPSPSLRRLLCTRPRSRHPSGDLRLRLGAKPVALGSSALHSLSLAE